MVLPTIKEIIMKNKIKIIITISLLFTLLLTGCETPQAGSKNYEYTSNLIHIKGNLYYYAETKIIYIIFNEYQGYKGYGYMSPYYSSDGNLCKFDERTNSFIEIKN